MRTRPTPARPTPARPTPARPTPTHPTPTSRAHSLFRLPSLLLSSLLLLTACAPNHRTAATTSTSLPATTPTSPPGASLSPEAETALLNQHIASLRAIVEGAEAGSRPEVLLLGTFHIANPGLDAHKSRYTFDIFSEEGQRQLNELLSRLESFKPTKILIERSPQYQTDIDTWYQGYLQGNNRNDPNEILTIGFALAQRLGHPRVYGFDARAEWLTSTPETPEAFTALATSMNMAWVLEDPVEACYSEMYKASDDIEETLTLRQRLRLMNHPDSLSLSHGAYFFFAGFRLADGTQFPGPDGFASAWHNRNLRMFSNLQRLAEPGDRILIIVGAGHAPILKHCIESCPTMTLVPVDTYLAPHFPHSPHTPTN